MVGARISEGQNHLLTQMLTCTDRDQRFCRTRNWLLVREGSENHQQLSSMQASGFVVTAKCQLRGLVRFVATRHGCRVFGLNDRQTAAACLVAVEKYGIEWSNGRNGYAQR